MTVPVFAFAAYSGTGKTTLIEKLIRELNRRGLQVAVIKHDGHKFEIDREGKDSWRFTQAGAKISVISSAEKTASIRREGLGIQKLLAGVDGVDIILVEGWKNEGLPRIGIARKATGKGFTAPVEQFIATVSDFEIPESPVPGFGLEDIEDICDFLLDKVNGVFAADRDGVPVQMKESRAAAAARVLVSAHTFDLLRNGVGECKALTVEQVTRIMGAAYPHQLTMPGDGTDLKLYLDEARCSVEIEAGAFSRSADDAELEALSAVSCAALAVCSACKAVQKDVMITDIHLLNQTFGTRIGCI